jgi:hypothetical protein
MQINAFMIPQFIINAQRFPWEFMACLFLCFENIFEKIWIFFYFKLI